jgi:hypothetical protein
MSTALKVVAWVLGSVVVLVLLGVGALWWSLSGGWDGIRPAAQPDDADVVEAREAGHEPLDRLTDPLETALTDGGTGLGRVEVEGCDEGQNNWKVQDGWTLSCAQASVLGATSAAGSVEQGASEADTAVRALGWAPTSYGEMEPVAGGVRAEGRYEHPDDPDAVLVVEVADPGQAREYLSLRRMNSTDDAPAQPVLDALGASSEVTVLATVERTYFQDD